MYLRVCLQSHAQGEACLGSCPPVCLLHNQAALILKLHMGLSHHMQPDLQMDTCTTQHRGNGYEVRNELCIAEVAWLNNRSSWVSDRHEAQLSLTA